MKLNYKTMLATAALLLVSGSAMGQSVDLSVKWKLGNQYRMEQDVVVDMTMPDPQGSGEIASKMKMVSVMSGAASVDQEGIGLDMMFDRVSMNMAMSGKVLMKYDSSKPNAENPMDKTMETLKEVKFKSIYGKWGQFIELTDFDDRLLSPEMGITMGSIERLLRQQSQMVPFREVGVGEVWESRIGTSLQGFDHGFMCDYAFKLASVKEVDGKQVARVEFTAEMEKVRVLHDEVEMLLSAKSITGYYLFDVSEGQFTESKLSFDMGADVQGSEMLMKTDLKIKYESSPREK